MTSYTAVPCTCGHLLVREYAHVAWCPHHQDGAVRRCALPVSYHAAVQTAHEVLWPRLAELQASTAGLQQRVQRRCQRARSLVLSASFLVLCASTAVESMLLALTCLGPAMTCIVTPLLRAALHRCVSGHGLPPPTALSAMGSRFCERGGAQGLDPSLQGEPWGGRQPTCIEAPVLSC